MSQDTTPLPSVQLLKQHRAIAVKQLLSVTETIRDIDNLLALHEPRLPTFVINDKVISLSAPNKNRVGIVTKVTPHFIYVAPLENKYKSFKKDPQNLSHYSFLSLVVSLQPNAFSAPPLEIEERGHTTSQRRSSRTRTSSSSHPPPIDTSKKQPSSPRKLSPVTPTQQRFTKQPPPISSPRKLSPVTRTEKRSCPKEVDPSSSPNSEDLSLATAQRRRRQYHIDRGLQRPFTPPSPKRARIIVKSTKTKITTTRTARSTKKRTGSTPGKTN